MEFRRSARQSRGPDLIQSVVGEFAALSRDELASTDVSCSATPLPSGGGSRVALRRMALRRSRSLICHKMAAMPMVLSTLAMRFTLNCAYGLIPTAMASAAPTSWSVSPTREFDQFRYQRSSHTSKIASETIIVSGVKCLYSGRIMQQYGALRMMCF